MVCFVRQWVFILFINPLLFFVSAGIDAYAKVYKPFIIKNDKLGSRVSLLFCCGYLIMLRAGLGLGTSIIKETIT